MAYHSVQVHWRRQALEAMFAADSARVDALENRARLLLDAQLLWDFD